MVTLQNYWLNLIMDVLGYLIFPCMSFLDRWWAPKSEEKCSLHLCITNSKLNILSLMPLVEPIHHYAYVAEYLVVADKW